VAEVTLTGSYRLDKVAPSGAQISRTVGGASGAPVKVPAVGAVGTGRDVARIVFSVQRGRLTSMTDECMIPMRIERPSDSGGSIVSNVKYSRSARLELLPAPAVKSTRGS
jgi:hypothetical protein